MKYLPVKLWPPVGADQVIKKLKMQDIWIAVMKVNASGKTGSLKTFRLLLESNP